MHKNSFSEFRVYLHARKIFVLKFFIRKQARVN